MATKETLAPSTDQLLTTKQVAFALNISPSTLEKARSTGLGNYPFFIRVGRNIRYRQSDISTWLDANREAVGAPLL